MQDYLPSLGKISFDADSIRIDDYPFEPSSIYSDPVIPAASIVAVSTKFRPYIQRANELITINAMEKENLQAFAIRNNIPDIEPSWIWDWILDPYLDTEFTPEDEERINRRLAEHGLQAAEVARIRAEVGEQMIKYNFDTMLWDWVSLNIFDALCAMRVKYDRHQFLDFYTRAMAIALKPKLPDHFRPLAESPRYIAGHIFERALVIDKQSRQQFEIGESYGDPTTALIDRQEQWILFLGHSSYLFRPGSERVNPGPPSIQQLEHPLFQSPFAARQTREDEIEVLDDPWSANPGVFRLDIRALTTTKIRDFKKLDIPYTEDPSQIDW